jgi:hypothetical protein
MDLIVPLYRVKRLGQESDRVPRIVVDIVLREYRTCSNAGAVGLQSEW